MGAILQVLVFLLASSLVASMRPKCRVEDRVKVLLRRANCRSDIELPRCTKSKTDN